MGCNYDPSYACASGYDAERGECCDAERHRIHGVLVFLIVLFSILCVGCCFAAAAKRRQQREEAGHALYRNS